MNRGFSTIKRILLIMALILVGLAATPGLALAADTTPPMTPAQQKRAERVQLEYEKLRTDTNDLGGLFEQAGGYRSTYAGFLASEQYHGRDTKSLENHLSVFDSYITSGTAARKNGLDILADRSGFDSNGSVININVVEAQILKALPYYLQSRSLLVSAVYNLHSGLDLYHQVTGVDVPNIPKLHFDPYYLASAWQEPTVPTLSPARQREAGRLISKADKLRKDLGDLQSLYDMAANYRQQYVSFVNSEQYHKRDTTLLDKDLPVFDSFINLGSNARSHGLDVLRNNGVDSRGNVTDINALDNSVQTALNDYLTSRNYLVKAIYEMHSALNRYHQVSGMDVPNVPKLHLSPYLLTP